MGSTKQSLQRWANASSSFRNGDRPTTLKSAAPRWDTQIHTVYTKRRFHWSAKETFMSPIRRSARCHSPAFSNALLTQLKLTTVGLSLALCILFCKILPILIHSNGIKHAWFQLVLVGLACFQQSKSTDSISRWKKHNGIAAQTDANRTFNPEKGEVSCSLNSMHCGRTSRQMFRICEVIAYCKNLWGSACNVALVTPKLRLWLQLLLPVATG